MELQAPPVYGEYEHGSRSAECSLLRRPETEPAIPAAAASAVGSIISSVGARRSTISGADDRHYVYPALESKRTTGVSDASVYCRRASICSSATSHDPSGCTCRNDLRFDQLINGGSHDHGAGNNNNIGLPSRPVVVASGRAHPPGTVLSSSISSPINCRNSTAASTVDDHRADIERVGVLTLMRKAKKKLFAVAKQLQHRRNSEVVDDTVAVESQERATRLHRTYAWPSPSDHPLLSPNQQMILAAADTDSSRHAFVKVGASPECSSGRASSFEFKDMIRWMNLNNSRNRRNIIQEPPRHSLDERELQLPKARRRSILTRESNSPAIDCSDTTINTTITNNSRRNSSSSTAAGKLLPMAMDRVDDHRGQQGGYYSPEPRSFSAGNDSSRRRTLGVVARLMGLDDMPDDGSAAAASSASMIRHRGPSQAVDLPNAAAETTDTAEAETEGIIMTDHHQPRRIPTAVEAQYYLSTATTPPSAEVTAAAAAAGSTSRRQHAAAESEATTAAAELDLDHHSSVRLSKPPPAASIAEIHHGSFHQRLPPVRIIQQQQDLGDSRCGASSSFNSSSAIMSPTTSSAVAASALSAAAQALLWQREQQKSQQGNYSTTAGRMQRDVDVSVAASRSRSPESPSLMQHDAKRSCRVRSRNHLHVNVPESLDDDHHHHLQLMTPRTRESTAAIATGTKKCRHCGSTLMSSPAGNKKKACGGNAQVLLPPPIVILKKKKHSSSSARDSAVDQRQGIIYRTTSSMLAPPSSQKLVSGPAQKVPGDRDPRERPAWARTRSSLAGATDDIALRNSLHLHVDGVDSASSLHPHSAMSADSGAMSTRSRTSGPIVIMKRISNSKHEFSYKHRDAGDYYELPATAGAVKGREADVSSTLQGLVAQRSEMDHRVRRRERYNGSHGSSEEIRISGVLDGPEAQDDHLEMWGRSAAAAGSPTASRRQRVANSTQQQLYIYHGHHVQPLQNNNNDNDDDDDDDDDMVQIKLQQHVELRSSSCCNDRNSTKMPLYCSPEAADLDDSGSLTHLYSDPGTPAAEEQHAMACMLEQQQQKQLINPNHSCCSISSNPPSSSALQPPSSDSIASAESMLRSLINDHESHSRPESLWTVITSTSREVLYIHQVLQASRFLEEAEYTRYAHRPGSRVECAAACRSSCSGGGGAGSIWSAQLRNITSADEYERSCCSCNNGCCDHVAAMLLQCMYSAVAWWLEAAGGAELMRPEIFEQLEYEWEKATDKEAEEALLQKRQEKYKVISRSPDGNSKNVEDHGDNIEDVGGELYRMSRQAAMKRKLVFDCVNEVLAETMEVCFFTLLFLQLHASSWSFSCGAWNLFHQRAVQWYAYQNGTNRVADSGAAAAVAAFLMLRKARRSDSIMMGFDCSSYEEPTRTMRMGAAEVLWREVKKLERTGVGVGMVMERRARGGCCRRRRRRRGTAAGGGGGCRSQLEDTSSEERGRNRIAIDDDERRRRSSAAALEDYCRRRRRKEIELELEEEMDRRHDHHQILQQQQLELHVLVWAMVETDLRSQSAAAQTQPSSPDAYALISAVAAEMEDELLHCLLADLLHPP